MRSVSVIVPCLNEEETINLLLNALYQQSYPRERLEIVIADGMSTDGTRAQIAAFKQQHPDLSIAVIDNASRRIPSALNLAIKASSGEYILRLDAHSMPRKDYVERSVNALEAGKGWNVGGVWDIHPGSDTWIARSIARAAAHPLGVGDALYRIGANARSVDTVPFGAYKRETVEKIGFYDESLLANEDYEFNARIRQAGGVVWLDPSIRSTYFARSTLASLLRQYARYGYWKWQMLKRYPGSLRWRQALPPLFVLALIALPLLAFWQGVFGWLWGLAVVSYALVLLGAAFQKVIKKNDMSLIIGMPLAMAGMHVSWGVGFLWSLLSTGFRKV